MGNKKTGNFPAEDGPGSFDQPYNYSDNIIKTNGFQ